MSDYIPEEGIILQILHKLPIKSLVRCTCVCKSWFSLIKNSNFISNHLKPSNKNNPLLLLLRYCSYQHVNNKEKYTEHFSLYFDDNKRYNPYMHLSFPFKTHNHEKPCFNLVGTVNGLICLADDDYFNNYKIIIWNPSIKKSVTLPKGPKPSTTCFKRVYYGLGFDSRSNDYKVLRFACRFLEQDNVEAEIYSLSMNSWKRICPPRSEVRYHDRQVFVNGVMHMLAFRSLRNVDEYHNVILGFDFGDEVFQEIKLPQSLADVNPFNLNVSVYKESIAVFEQHRVGPGPGGVVHIWVMEHYGVVQSWTWMISFYRPEDELPTALGFRKNGELFLQMPDGEIVSYEPNSRENNSLGVRGCIPSIDYFVETLELLDNANAESDPALENDTVRDLAGDATAAND